MAALVAAGLLGGIAAILTMGRYAPSLADFGRQHMIILVTNLIVAVGLLAVILANLVRLIRDYRRRAPGARLRARLVAIFVGLCLAPLLVVYFFALQFLNSGIDSWFDTDLERELSFVLKLSRETLDLQATSRLIQTSGFASALGNLEGEPLSRALAVLRADAGADELTVFAGMRLEKVVSDSGTEALPPRLPEDALTELLQSRAFVALEPQGNARYQIRSAVQIPGDRASLGPRYLQAIFPVADRQGRLADAVQDTWLRYSELRFLRQPIRASLTVTLTLVLLLSLLTAAGGAFFFARRLAAPIEALAAGTEAVAKGDFDSRLAPGSADEVGFLMDSFNDMIGRLAKAREDNRHGQQQLESERANLAAILGRLSTGVIAIDAFGHLQIVNDAAGEILAVDLGALTGESFDSLADAGPLAAGFVAAWRTRLAGDERDWRGQIELHGEGPRRILNCASSPLPGEAGRAGGAIVVFDDVTDLLDAQREAAWGEVARRLAHEIKNPLTPIRLAAERIRRRYLPAMTVEEGQVLDRSTYTIVQQVEAMRDMVNAFSEYARAPAVSVDQVDLSQLVREVSWLYRAQEGQPAVQLSVDEHVEVEADAVRIRQLLHNLIRNAQEATEGQPDGCVHIQLRRTAGKVPGVELTVADNGPGIDVEVLPRIFEPYVTSKKKGTGLGLAIVRKLVDEQGGSITAENLPDGGARFVVRLPLSADKRPGENADPGPDPEHRRASA